MCLFRKKKASVKAREDNDLVSENSRSIEALIVLAEQSKDENREAIVNDFKNLQEKLRYLIPSQDEKVREYDKKIKNLIEDLRIALVKDDGELSNKASKIVTQIKLAIADRNAKI